MSKKYEPSGRWWEAKVREAMEKTADDMRKMAERTRTSQVSIGEHFDILDILKACSKPSRIKRLRTWITDHIWRRLRRRQGLQWIDSKQLDTMLIKHQREIHGETLVFDRPKDHPNPARIVIAATGMLNQYGLS